MLANDCQPQDSTVLKMRHYLLAHGHHWAWHYLKPMPHKGVKGSITPVTCFMKHDRICHALALLHLASMIHRMIHCWCLQVCTIQACFVAMMAVTAQGGPGLQNLCQCQWVKQL